MEIKKQKAAKIRIEEEKIKKNLIKMKRDRSRKIMDRNYMQSKTVSPDTLIKRKNEEIVFVKTHCFCIPKHV